MASPRASDILGHVTLVTGPEEFLNQRTVRTALDAVRAADPESELSETTADQLTMATLGELAAPSLFSSIRCVVVRGLENLPDEVHAGLVEYAAAPAEEIGLVLVHSGGQKGTGLLNKLRKVGPTVTEVKSASLKPSEVARFVEAEVRTHGGRIAQDAAQLLVQAVGHDLRALAGAAHQLTSDFPDEPITESVVKRYFGGRAEVKSFAIADAALYGRTAGALEELRWALDSGTAPVLVTSAFAGGLRGLARVAGSRGMRDADLAREAGVPPWKLRTLREQARGWDERGLARAITAVAQADADIKGAASDAAYALERMVLRVTGARAGR